MSEPVLYEMHMHTPLCRHSVGEPEEYAEAARRRGLKGIVVTCHNPFPDRYAQGSRMYYEEFPEYVAIVQRAQEAYAGVVDVRLGLECDFSPGFEPFLEEQLASHAFHHVLGSIHPQVTQYYAKYWAGHPVEYQKLYFDHLAQAAESGLFDTLSHPDLVKTINPEDWRLEDVLDDIRRALDRIAAAGTAMELNTSGLLKVYPEMNPSVPMLREMRERGIPVVVGADAHHPDRVADHFEEALDTLREVGYETVSLFLNRQRREIPIETALASLTTPAAA